VSARVRHGQKYVSPITRDHYVRVVLALTNHAAGLVSANLLLNSDW